jgi:hypothetical protein
MVMVKKQWLVLVAALALGLALAAVAWAWTSGPSVSGGKNPLVTLVFHAQLQAAGTTAKGPVYEVPQGQRLVITDIVTAAGNKAGGAHGAGGNTLTTLAWASGCVLVDSQAVACDQPAFGYGNSGSALGWRPSLHLETGVAVAPGSKVQLYASNAMLSGVSYIVTATGYLMRN